MQNHLNAAKGWLELGNHAEASRELEHIGPAMRLHPDVLEVRWQIYAKTKMWTAALEIATAISELAPDRPFGWVHQAFSLHALGRTVKAYELLKNIAGQFSALASIPYSLACYACQLDRADEAFAWFERAVQKGDPKVIVRAGLEEILLQPIWSRVRQQLNGQSISWHAPKTRRNSRLGRSFCGQKLGGSGRRWRT